ncbi:MAG: formate/nitrite transporter family protein [Clostridia bacterium]|nr:formate/nitrite transporter family protein [Clostridia bacterium]
MAMLGALISAVFAGCMIGIAGTTCLSVENAYVGPLLFCVGLYTICAFGLRLYTGRVGYILDSHKKEDIINLILTWVGNYIGAALCGFAAAYSKGNIQSAALKIAENRLQQDFFTTLLLAFFCGMLMYIAVHTYKITSGKTLGMLLCVPAFILSGFEHSVADMYYFAAAGEFVKGIPQILIVTLGNALGAFAVGFGLRFKK